MSRALFTDSRKAEDQIGSGSLENFRKIWAELPLEFHADARPQGESFLS